MIGIGLRRAPEGHQPVADVLVDGAAGRLDRRTDAAQQVVQVGRGLGRRPAARIGGIAFEIAEQDGDGAVFAGRQGALLGDQALDQRARQVGGGEPQPARHALEGAVRQVELADLAVAEVRDLLELQPLDRTGGIGERQDRPRQPAADDDGDDRRQQHQHAARDQDAAHDPARPRRFAAGQVIADDQRGRPVVVDLAVEPAMAAVADPVPVARDGAAAAAQPGDLVGLGRPHGGQHRIVDLVQVRQPPAGALLGAALLLAEPGMGQHLVAAGQDERLAPARELEALDEARQVRRADGGTDDAAELPAHADRHDDRQDRLADDERPLRLGPLRPVQGAGLGEQRIGERQVLAPLRPHAAVGAREAHRLALDGDDDEAHGLWCRGKRAEREALPLLAVVEVDLALGHGLADIGELVAHRLEMRPQALLDHVDRDLVELARRGVEVALGGEVGDADHRHHGEEDQPDEHDRQQPRDRPACGLRRLWARARQFKHHRSGRGCVAVSASKKWQRPVVV